jgi:hypothetical protein
MKKNIPTHDMQTGDLNPYYKELTGEKNPLKLSDDTIVRPEYRKHFDKHIDKMPNQKWHQIISFIKSAIRIFGYILIPFDMFWAAAILIVSELIGIVEELV